MTDTDPYVDVNGVLLNNLGLTSADGLRRAEADLSFGVFVELADEVHLGGLSRSAFVGRLAHYYAEINAIHPFREGNGRAQRAFLGQLSRDADWRVAWSELDGEENNTASAAGLHGDERPLLDLLEDIIRPL